MTKQEIIYPTLSEGTLTPAYGRDYRSSAAVIADFRSGKDFKAHFVGGSTYCSIRNSVIGEMVKLRYDKLTKALFYTITANDFVNIGK